MPVHPINLLVGENGTGKSRTIEAIRCCADFIAQSGVNHGTFSLSGNIVCQLGFEDDSHVIDYEFAYDHSQKSVVKESLVVTSPSGEAKTVIARDNENGELNGVSINPPTDKLIIHVRRDVEELPWVEKIIEWAENVYFLPFTELKDLFFSRKPNIADYLAEFNETQKNQLLANLRSLGYYFREYSTFQAADLNFETFQEEGVRMPISLLSMSSGMFRVLYVLTVMEYMASSDKPSLMLIDDLGEGLDYQRSVKLGKMILDFCRKHGISFISSTNDNFLMDIVPLADWIILMREGERVDNINADECSELFENFSFTGLNNFSLISSDFIDRYKKSNPDK